MFYFGVFFLILQSTLSNGDNVIACENEYLNIKCPSDDTIIIKSANYGRTDSLVCPDDDAFFNKNNRCISPDALAIVGKKCDGHSSCSINATNDIFGNPCNNTTKYLSVDYDCKNVSCPENEKYSPCASCQKTCETLENNTLCKCSSGCACKEGLVRSKNDGKCVSINTCTGYNGNIERSLIEMQKLTRKLEEETSINGRIMGGQDASISNYPYQVSLQYGSGIFGGIFINHICGGSVLTSQWVLTAANCIVTYQNQLFQFPFWIRAGSSYRNIGGQFVIVYRTIVHPNYSATQFVNDIALVQTKSPLVLNNPGYPIKALKLPRRSDRALGLSTLTGWGYNTGIIFLSGSEILQVANLSIVTNQACMDILAAKSVYAVLPNSQLCTVPVHGSVYGCIGDSGSPLVVRRGSNIIQAGIMSYFYGNCRVPGYPSGIFTRVAEYIDFIYQYVS